MIFKMKKSHLKSTNIFEIEIYFKEERCSNWESKKQTINDDMYKKVQI